MENPAPKICWTVFLVIALLALAVRFPRLGERPMHTDESVNAYIVGQLLEGHTYHYDPQDRHGPVLYAVAWPIAKLCGINDFAGLTETSLRIGPVIAGAATVFLFAAFATQIGFFPAVVAALFYAISPLCVYYSRDFIHETLFAAATLAALISGFYFLKTNSVRHGILFGTSAGFMLAAKETAAIHFAAFGIAAVGGLLPLRQPLPFKRALKPVVIAAASFCFVMVVLYTWGGFNFGGLGDLIKAVPNFASRATGQGHEKPMWYYLALLGGGWSGAGLFALAILGAVSSKSFFFQRFLMLYTVAIFILYSLIPYKTPWLALNLCLPIILLAGIGVVWICRAFQGRGLISGVSLGAVLICALGHDTWHRVFADPAGERNPYAYAQTVEDVTRLSERLEQLATTSNHKLRIAVVEADPWPLPWYLRKFDHVGFWQPDQWPEGFDVYITSAEVTDAQSAHLAGWRPEFFGVRPEVLVLLWQSPAPAEQHE